MVLSITMQSPSNEMDVYVSELQKKFDRLKVLYEQFFMGIEKIEPLTARKELTRTILNLQQTHLRGTGLRFKVATLIQKWNIYQSYWNRTMRDIEAGRYVRHVATARRRAESKGLPFPAEEMGLHLPRRTHPHPAEPRDDGPPEDLKEYAEGPPPPPVQAPAADPKSSSPALPAIPPSPPGDLTPTPPPPSSSPSIPRPTAPVPAGPRVPGRSSPSVPQTIGSVPGMSEPELRALHQRVVAAQRALGEPVEMRFETLVVQLARQVPKLMSEHACKSVSFDVVTRDGRVKLKPSPQK